MQENKHLFAKDYCIYLTHEQASWSLIYTVVLAKSVETHISS